VLCLTLLSDFPFVGVITNNTEVEDILLLARTNRQTPTAAGKLRAVIFYKINTCRK